jgi:hypothetical protein
MTDFEDVKAITTDLSSLRHTFLDAMPSAFDMTCEFDKIRVPVYLMCVSPWLLLLCQNAAGLDYDAVAVQKKPDESEEVLDPTLHAIRSLAFAHKFAEAVTHLKKSVLSQERIATQGALMRAKLVDDSAERGRSPTSQQLGPVVSRVRTV